MLIRRELASDTSGLGDIGVALEKGHRNGVLAYVDRIQAFVKVLDTIGWYPLDEYYGEVSAQAEGVALEQIKTPARQLDDQEVSDADTPRQLETIEAFRALAGVGVMTSRPIPPEMTLRLRRAWITQYIRAAGQLQEIAEAYLERPLKNGSALTHPRYAIEELERVSEMLGGEDLTEGVRIDIPAELNKWDQATVNRLAEEAIERLEYEAEQTAGAEELVEIGRLIGRLDALCVPTEA